MTTTFLFITELSEQGYPCLVLDEKGEITQELETRDFSTLITRPFNLNVLAAATFAFGASL